VEGRPRTVGDLESSGEAHERFRSAFDDAGIGMAILGLEGRFLRVNRELCRLLGRSAEELLAGPGVSTLWIDADAATDRAAFERIMRGEPGPSSRDLRYRGADDLVRWGSTTTSLVRDADGRPQYAIGQLIDITARREAEQRAERRAAQQTAVARLSQRALTERDLPALAKVIVTTITELVDGAVAGLTRLDPDDGKLRPMVSAHGSLSSEQARLDDEHVAHTCFARTPVVVPDTAAEDRFDTTHMLARGVASAVTVPVAGEGDRLFGVVGMANVRAGAFDDEDVAFLQAVANVLTGAVRRMAAESDLRHRSLHDSLTQLPNRALLLDRLRLSLARARRERLWVALIYLDIDDFKHVNESLGHNTGDALLRALGGRMAEALRPSDTLARFSGDEFAIVCDGLSGAEEAAAIAQRVLAGLGRPLRLTGVDLDPRASAGIALAGPGSAPTAEDLVRDADTAMYRAKADGRGGFELFDDHMRADTIERMALIQELRRAITRSELRLVYQPIISLHERRVIGFEALARWTHAVRGEIFPDRFIPLAEAHGLIAPLGSWVLGEALDQVRRWRDAALAVGDLRMSVNVSRVQLGNPGLSAEVLRALSERDIESAGLTVEVTESAVMEDPDTAHATLGELHAHGVQIALDDFGVGQSSLACLRDLPLDGLKLDRAFITSLATSREAAAIVRAVTDMAHTLQFGVVAEGIETEAQAQVVEELGCDMGQGFLFARPVTPEQAPAEVERLNAALAVPRA
jgi:diguanylate cyclase (GGDEF)-like protein/PAS domain S-box-containing protein